MVLRNIGPIDQRRLIANGELGVKDSTEEQTAIVPASPGYRAAKAEVPDAVVARAQSAQDVADYLTGRLSPVVAWKIVDGASGAIAYPVTLSCMKHDSRAPVFVVTPEGLVRGEMTNFNSITHLAGFHFDVVIGGMAGVAQAQENLNERISEITMKTAIGKARGS